MSNYFISIWFELALIGTALIGLLISVYKIPVIKNGISRNFQKAIAALYEIILYWSHPFSVIKSELRLFACNFRILLYSMPMILIFIIVSMIGSDAVQNRYGYQSAIQGQDIYVYIQAEEPVFHIVFDNRDNVIPPEIVARVFNTESQSLWLSLRPDTPGIFIAKCGETGRLLFELNVSVDSAVSNRHQSYANCRTIVEYPQKTNWLGNACSLWTIIACAGSAIWSVILVILTAFRVA